MKNYRTAILFFAFISIAGVAFSQGRGAGAGAAPSAASPRGPGTLPPATAGTPAPSRTDNVPPQLPSTPRSPEVGKGTSNKVGAEITEHPALNLKLQPLLPPGSTLDDASNGFKNLGQFVAAVHVSSNLSLPWDQVKAKMVTDKSSLGDTIHALKPDLPKDQVNAEVKRAEAQAKEDTRKP